jgi:ferrous iron transport protein B
MTQKVRAKGQGEIITSATGQPIRRPIQIALVGNPNTGKTTLFNALTGLRQRIGNYPGVTVSMATGTVFLDAEVAYVTDLPGTYSLAASSPDEKIVHDYLNGNISNASRPDVIVCVLDATNLKKNLFLASQLAEHQIPTVIALSFWDTVKKQGSVIDPEELSRQFGVPVVPIDAVRNQGLDTLKQEIQRARKEQLLMNRIVWGLEVEEIFDQFEHTLKIAGIKVNRPEIQRLIFDSSLPHLTGIHLNPPILKQGIDAARAHFRRLGFHPHTAEAVIHHKYLQQVLDGSSLSDPRPGLRRGESIDRLLTHRYWGLAIFLVFMYLVFQSVYSWSAPFMDLIDFGKEQAQDWVSSGLGNFPQLQSLIKDGMIEGVGAFLIFLPQILILFFFISLLEETGYMARAAFLMDRLFSWCGLSGKSFVPLLSSFACAVPGILATRTIEDRKSRLITILIAPLMSCSARLPVYVLMIGAFVEPIHGPLISGLTLFAMHFLGIFVALPIAFLFHKLLKKTPSRPFIMEMPDYQIPKWRNLVWRMWHEAREFILRAGTVIFAITVLIWALLYYPRSESVEENTRAAFFAVAASEGLTQEQWNMALQDPDSEIAMALERAVDAAYINQSYLSRFGKKVQPAFEWAGFDWRISVGILASFPAREVIISTLGVMMSLGGDVDEESSGLRSALANATWNDGPRSGQPLFTLPVAFAIMVFFALCQQCGSTLAVIRSEMSSRWALVSFCYMTAMAWIATVATYQALTLLGL